jgi:hypothetical protein
MFAFEVCYATKKLHAKLKLFQSRLILEWKFQLFILLKFISENCAIKFCKFTLSIVRGSRHDKNSFIEGNALK